MKKRSRNSIQESSDDESIIITANLLTETSASSNYSDSSESCDSSDSDAYIIIQDPIQLDEYNDIHYYYQGQGWTSLEEDSDFDSFDSFDLFFDDTPNPSEKLPNASMPSTPTQHPTPPTPTPTTPLTPQSIQQMHDSATDDQPIKIEYNPFAFSKTKPKTTQKPQIKPSTPSSNTNQPSKSNILLNHLLKTPLNMSSVTATAINSTLLVLSEMRKRDPAGALDPVTLNARIKAAAQAAVAAATASSLYSKNDHEFPKNIQDLTALVNSQTAIAAALIASKKKSESIEPMNLEELVDFSKLEEILSSENINSTLNNIPHGESDSHLDKHLSRWKKVPITSFRKSQKRQKMKTSKKEFQSAVRKSVNGFRKMSATLGTSAPVWMSPDLRPFVDSENHSSDNDHITILPPSLLGTGFDGFEPLKLN